MQQILHRASDRGVAEHGWLHSRFSFSFADWYEPTRMGFGALRVINDDIVDPSSGFGMHPHRDMEIVTIVMEGTVTHKDSMGNVGTVKAGEVQVMSAGTGVVHAEYNESPDTALKLFQIWIVPKSSGIAPRYGQKAFAAAQPGVVETLVGPMGSDAPLTINQDAYIARVKVLAGQPLHYSSRVPQNAVYLLVVDGTIEVAGAQLGPRDALGLSAGDIIILATTDAMVLIFDVPL